jgi:hypothetical protein
MLVISLLLRKSIDLIAAKERLAYGKGHNIHHRGHSYA